MENYDSNGSHTLNKKFRKKEKVPFGKDMLIWELFSWVAPISTIVWVQMLKTPEEVRLLFPSTFHEKTLSGVQFFTSQTLSNLNYKYVGRP